jgi:glycosyltransferase involved in cell wall biosynthesis
MNYLVAVDRWFTDAPGGSGRVAYDIAQVMRDRGHHVAAIAMRLPGESLPDAEDRDGMRVARYTKPALPSWRPDAPVQSIRAAAEAVRQHFGAERWDVVHMHTPYTSAGAMEALGSQPRYLATVHSPAVLEQRINWGTEGAIGQIKLLLGLGAIRRLEARIMRAAAGVHTLSEFTRRELDRFHGTASKTQVIPHWRRADLVRTVPKAEARQRLGWPADERIVFSVRALVERNGLDDAIDAMADAVRERKCLLFIGGRGPLRPKLEGMAAGRGIAERVRFLGRMSDEELALAYQAADLFLLPTKALECFGLITIEALSYGCPVIATNAGAIPEVLAPLGEHYIVPAGDVEAIGRRVNDWLDGRMRVHTPEALIDYVHQRYEASSIVPRIASFLEEGSCGREAVAAAQANV